MYRTERQDRGRIAANLGELVQEHVFNNGFETIRIQNQKLQLDCEGFQTTEYRTLDFVTYTDVQAMTAAEVEYSGT